MALKMSTTPVKKRHLPKGADRFVWNDFQTEKPKPPVDYGRILKMRVDKRT